MKAIISRFKWWRLKRKLFRICKKTGKDLDGDIVVYKDRKYYVHVLRKEVKLTNIPVYAYEYMKQDIKTIKQFAKKYYAIIGKKA